MDAHALRRQGWTISAIARHLDRDRQTIRAYLTGGRVAGPRASSGEDPLGPFVAYLAQRLRDDQHVRATALFDEDRPANEAMSGGAVGSLDGCWGRTGRPNGWRRTGR